MRCPRLRRRSPLRVSEMAAEMASVFGSPECLRMPSDDPLMTL